MRRATQLFGICWLLCLLAACGESHFMTDASYRSRVEQDFQQKIRVAEEEFYASIARPTDAHLLGIVEGSPVLDLVRTTYNESNEVVEYTLSVARADQFKYKVYHQRSD